MILFTVDNSFLWTEVNLFKCHRAPNTADFVPALHRAGSADPPCFLSLRTQQHPHPWQPPRQQFCPAANSKSPQCWHTALPKTSGKHSPLRCRLFHNGPLPSDPPPRSGTVIPSRHRSITSTASSEGRNPSPPHPCTPETASVLWTTSLPRFLKCNQAPIFYMNRVSLRILVSNLFLRSLKSISSQSP